MPLDPYPLKSETLSAKSYQIFEGTLLTRHCNDGTVLLLELHRHGGRQVLQALATDFPVVAALKQSDPP